MNTPYSSGREVALRVLYQVDKKRAYANIALDRFLRKGNLKDVERRFAAELAYGSIKRRNTLDWVLRHFMRRSLEKTDPWVRNLLRLGAYQILFLDRVPTAAAVNETVELTKKYGHPGTVKFVNGILRSLVRNLDKLKFPTIEEDPILHISLVHSHPEWMVGRWLKRFGIKETIKICQKNNEPPPASLRTNTLKCNREELQKVLKKEGYDTTYGKYAPECLCADEYGRLEELRAFREGLFTVQDEGSMLVSRLLAPDEGAVVVDACAAPGTKTTHLAQLMNNKGRVVALDIHEKKLKAIIENCRRLGLTSVNVEKGDARLWGKRHKNYADFILVDAPCSGLGVLRRRPDARWHKREEDVTELQKLQKEILVGISPALKDGGVLVYSTCTIEPEENEEVIKWFLKENPQFVLDDRQCKYLPSKLFCRAVHNTGFQNCLLQLFPHIHGTDGFFMARLIKAR